jgi:hypothetical protein
MGSALSCPKGHIRTDMNTRLSPELLGFEGGTVVAKPSGMTAKLEREP